MTGSAAAGAVLPQQLLNNQVSSWHDPEFNLDYTRYQQDSAGVDVDGAQVTVVSRAGQKLIVAGAYYPDLLAARPPALSLANALAVAAEKRGGLNSLPAAVAPFAFRRAQLRLDPETGRLFYLVATGAPGANRYQQIDAQSGALIDAWSGVDQINPGRGVGVKGDTKTLTPGSFATVGDLTRSVNGTPRLQSWDDKLLTYNAANGTTYPSTPMSDLDDVWNSGTQAAAVDAQYYAALTVQFYRHEFGWDMIDGCVMPPSNPWPHVIRSVVHYSTNYDNAFWDDIRYYMVYGDGNSLDRALSAGQDVVSHELTHGVTQCRADLHYRNQSGALNEAFSDIMATSAEWTMQESTSSNCRLAPGQIECPDWLIGEDLARTASGAVIRNFADPGTELQPSHFEDRVYIGTNVDSGGVHYNSGIVNHAYYLLVNGGRNARCSGPTDSQADCDVVVPPTSLDHAMHIFFSGFGLLSYDATMCDARNATVGQAGVLYPGSVTDLAAVLLAWQAVGLGESQCAPTDFSISLVDPTIELAPNGSGQIQVGLWRGTEAGQVNYAVEDAAPATVGPPSPTFNTDSAGTQIPVNADSDATDGAYPILVTASGGGGPHYAAGTLVIDATVPSAAVANVRFVPTTTVTSSGVIPLRVIWSAADAGSGVTSAELDHSPDGSAWTALYGPAAPLSPTQFSATAGPHQFHVIATDAVGNSATSPALVSLLTDYQEDAAQIVYRGGWKTFSSATAWGRTRFSKNRGAFATFAFNGTDIVWVAQRGPRRGVANVFVDGVKTHVDLYSSALSERRVVFIAGSLAAGPHIVKIVVRATPGRPRVDLDGFFVLSQ